MSKHKYGKLLFRKHKLYYAIIRMDMSFSVVVFMDGLICKERHLYNFGSSGIICFKTLNFSA